MKASDHPVWHRGDRLVMFHDRMGMKAIVSLFTQMETEGVSRLLPPMWQHQISSRLPPTVSCPGPLPFDCASGNRFAVRVPQPPSAPIYVWEIRYGMCLIFSFTLFCHKLVYLLTDCSACSTPPQKLSCGVPINYALLPSGTAPTHFVTFAPPPTPPSHMLLLGTL